MAPLPKSTARKHTVFLLCLFSSLLVSFALFTYFMLLPLSQFTTHPRVSSKSYVSAHVGALKTSSKTVEFGQHDAYRSLGHEHDHLWHDDLLPPNGGYLTLARGQDDTERVAIAMFHQLRCLAVIRSQMQHLHGMAAQGSRRRADQEDEDPVVRRHRHRALACLDYLRQSLLCHADATMEPPRPSDNGTGLTDSGTGTGERQCRDWNILYKASARSDEEPVMPDDLR